MRWIETIQEMFPEAQNIEDHRVVCPPADRVQTYGCIEFQTPEIRIGELEKLAQAFGTKNITIMCGILRDGGCSDPDCCSFVSYVLNIQIDSITVNQDWESLDA